MKMPSKEHLPDVRTRLHGDDAHVVLLVRPDEEVHRVVREDPAAVGPVATHPGGEHHRRAARPLGPPCRRLTTPSPPANKEANE